MPNTKNKGVITGTDVEGELIPASIPVTSDSPGLMVEIKKYRNYNSYRRVDKTTPVYYEGIYYDFP